eukprot:maker-scaffold353_size198981-snap-gene-0.33 protein:Tk05249 transcript:maker-scaffold353_size198981-snap-gene-0.33-mRNA-1 annotation:"predicted protein"
MSVTSISGGLLVLLFSILLQSVQGNSFSAIFPSVTNFQCFGFEVANISNLDVEGELDVCIVGLVTGVVILMSVYPFVGLLFEREARAFGGSRLERDVEELDAHIGDLTQGVDGSAKTDGSAWGAGFGSQFQKSRAPRSWKYSN